MTSRYLSAIQSNYSSFSIFWSSFLGHFIILPTPSSKSLPVIPDLISCFQIIWHWHASSCFRLEFYGKKRLKTVHLRFGSIMRLDWTGSDLRLILQFRFWALRILSSQCCLLRPLNLILLFDFVLLYEALFPLSSSKAHSP